MADRFEMFLFQVLSHLIGFSAEESITLRQQARKYPKVKDYLTKVSS